MNTGSNFTFETGLVNSPFCQLCNVQFGGGVAGTAGTIAVSGTQNISNISFKPASGGGDYKLNGGGLALQTYGCLITTTIGLKPIISSIISGTGGITYTGAGATDTLTLAGANTYSGGTTINAGTLKAGAITSAFGASTNPMTINTGGALDLNGFSESVGILNGAGTITNLAAGTTDTLTINTGAGTGSFTGIIQDGSGKTAVTVNGSNWQYFYNNNTYSGTTLVTGYLFSASGWGISPYSHLHVVSPGYVQYADNINRAVAGISGNGNIAMAGLHFSFGSDNLDTSFSGYLGGGGGFNVWKGGTGKTTFLYPAAYGNNWNILSGTIEVGNGTAVKASNLTNANIYLPSPGTLTYNSSANFSITNYHYSNGNLNFVGTGTTTFAAYSGLSGPVTISNGTVIHNSPSNLSTGNIAVVSPGTLNYNTTAGLKLTGVHSGNGNMVMSGTIIDTFMAASTFTGALSVNSGSSFTLGDGTAASNAASFPAASVVNNGKYIINVPSTQTSWIAMPVSFTGSGNVSLTGRNFIFNNNLSCGAFNFNGLATASALAANTSISPTITCTSANIQGFWGGQSTGAPIVYTINTSAVNGPITYNGITDGVNGPAYSSMQVGNAGTGTITFLGANTFNTNTGSAGSYTYTGAFAGNGTLTFAGTAANTLTLNATGAGTLSGNINQGSSATAIVIGGTQTLTLSGANTASSLSVNTGAQLVLAGTSSEGQCNATVNGTLTYTASPSGTYTITVNNGGVLNMGGFTFPGSINIIVNPGGIVNP